MDPITAAARPAAGQGLRLGAPGRPASGDRQGQREESVSRGSPHPVAQAPSRSRVLLVRLWHVTQRFFFFLLNAGKVRRKTEGSFFTLGTWCLPGLVEPLPRSILWQSGCYC